MNGVIVFVVHLYIQQVQNNGTIQVKLYFITKLKSNQNSYFLFYFGLNQLLKKLCSSSMAW